MKRLLLSLTSLGFILLSRWMMGIGKPLQDLHLARRAWWQVQDWTVSAWSIIWRAYGPVTRATKSKWTELQERYLSGGYGVQGT